MIFIFTVSIVFIITILRADSRVSESIYLVLTLKGSDVLILVQFAR